MTCSTLSYTRSSEMFLFGFFGGCALFSEFWRGSGLLICLIMSSGLLRLLGIGLGGSDCND